MGAAADSRSLLLSNNEISPQTLNRNRVDYRRMNNGSRFNEHFRTLIGFVFGFLMALTTLLFYDRYLLLSEQLERHTTATEYYQTGYMEALQEIASEEDMLRQRLISEVRVLCMVLTAPKYHQSRAAHVRATWGKRCTKLIFVSSELDEELGAVKVVEEDADIYDQLWNKTREGFRYVYEEHFEDYDWFIKADDDTYVIMENLRYMLYGYYPETPIYFGYKMVRYEVEYMSGGAAYVLSKEALRRLMNNSFHNETLCPPGLLFGIEDVYIGICLQNADVLLADSRTAISLIPDNKPKFIPLDMLVYLRPDTNYSLPNWLIKMTPYKILKGLDCCSNNSIAFHYVTPANMYLYEFFIYHLQVAGLHGHVAKLPNKITTKEAELKFPGKFNGTPIVNLTEYTMPYNS